MRTTFKKSFSTGAHTHTHTLIALGGFLILIGSVGVAMGISFPRHLRDSLVAMLPQAIVAKTPPVLVATPVSGYGDVIPANELTLTSRVSGFVTDIVVREGERVSEDDVLMQLNPGEVQRAIRDAETALAQAELARTQADDAERAVASFSVDRSDAAYASTLDEAYVEISDTFLMVPNIVRGLTGMLYGGVFPDEGGTNYLIAHADRANSENSEANAVKTRAEDRHTRAKRDYEIALGKYRSLTRSSEARLIEQELAETYDLALALADALKAAGELHVFLKDHLESRSRDVPEVFALYEEARQAYALQLNDQLAVLLNVRRNLDASQTPLADARAPQTLSRAEADLEVKIARDALTDATARLRLFTIRAPFAGVVAAYMKKTGDYVADGAPVVTLITDDTLARIALKQENATQVKVGQGVRIILSGSDISTTGRVVEMDAQGTRGEDGITRFIMMVSLADERFKPGMQVSAQFLD